MSIFENFSHVNLKIMRAMKHLEDLRISIEDMQQEYVLKQERQDKKNETFAKKYTTAIKDLDDEIKLNNELHEDMKKQKNKIKLLEIEKNNLEYDLKKANEKINKLLDYKNRKRRNFKNWLKNRIKFLKGKSKDDK